MDEVKNVFTKEHKLTLVNRENLNITGVSRVEAASETIVVLRLDKEILQIFGKNMHISKLDVVLGNIEIIGEVSSLKYDGKREKTNIIKRIFG